AHLPTGPAHRPDRHHGDDAPQEVVGAIRDHDVHEELALLDEWERESAERLATLESAVGSELQRLTVAVEASRAGLAATSDLEALRTEVVEGMAASRAELGADLEAEMVEQLRLVLDEAVKQGDARAAAVAAELNGRDDASVGREEFAALRSELKEALSRHMTASQAELQRRVGLLDAAIADARTQLAERLDQMAALVSTEAARASERASDRAAAAVAPVQADLRVLQEQMQQVITMVAARGNNGS
ncbi:MAG: hypothetical protein M3450_02225, partial [Actinomycetota bacterium]|nr:hypothetical protein [Actinomycetota bacterium]